MNGLAPAQHKHDSQLPEDTASFFRRDELEFNKDEHRSRFNTAYVTDQQIEQFIVDLDAAHDKDLFLENTIGALPRSASNDYPLHIAMAHLWVIKRDAVDEIVGRVFWQWAKNATFMSLR